MIEAIGTIGSVLLAACSIPLCKTTLQQKFISLDPLFLWAWFLGEAFGLIYVWGDWILMLNYGVNTLCLLPVVYYNKIPNGKSLAELIQKQRNITERENK